MERFAQELFRYLDSQIAKIIQVIKGALRNERTPLKLYLLSEEAVQVYGRLQSSQEAD